jgi:adenylate cyclase
MIGGVEGLGSSGRGVFVTVSAEFDVARNWHLPWLRGSHPAPRLSIVVLPFANIGNDAEQQYFADGITEDVTTDLSPIVGMFEISRNTAFTYRNRSIDTKEIGRELGVRYVLGGSGRRSGDRVRINTQLTDAETDTHLWAQRFDRDIGNLFALQNEITGRIANALNLELIAAEATRPTDNPDALDYLFRGRAATLKPLSVHRGTGLGEFARGPVLDRVTESEAADLARAEELVAQALAASPRSPTAHRAKAQVLRAQGRCREAIPEFEVVLAINRNAADVLNILAGRKLSAGSLEELIPLEEQAIRLSPRDPRIGHFYFHTGHVHLLQSRSDEAILWLEKARGAVPELPFVHMLLASAYGLKGETELAEARRLAGEGSFPSIAKMKANSHVFLSVPSVRALAESTYFTGLRKAGMPEE